LKNYGHLTSTERAQIEELHKQGDGPCAIGRQLGRAKSTVSRELRRGGSGGHYEAARAQEAAEELGRKARRKSRKTGERIEEIRVGLGKNWSPQQIAGRWAQEGRAAQNRLSHESIYDLIGADRRAKGTLWQLLPRGGRKRRRDRCGTRRGHRLKVTPAQEITARPAEINERQRAGDWEVDLMIGAGQQGVLLVAVERKSRVVRCRALESKEAEVVHRALVALLCAEVVLSLTYDRGLEWMRHAEIAAALGAVSYFCRPYHSWEKGGVENMNGLLRRYLPKGISFPYEEVDHQWILEVEAEINGRPRRMHGYRTPLEVARESHGRAL
jgi:transposase, IS30 family